MVATDTSIVLTFEDNSATVVNHGVAGSSCNAVTKNGGTATNLWAMQSGAIAPYITTAGANYGMVIPSNSVTDNNGAQTWYFTFYLWGTTGTQQKLWDKGEGGCSIYLDTSGHLIILQCCSGGGSAGYYYWQSSNTFPAGHLYHLQLSWYSGTYCSDRQTPIAYVSTDTGSLAQMTMNAASYNPQNNYWFNDAGCPVCVGNYSGAAPGGITGGYYLDAGMMAYRWHEGIISLPDTATWAEDRLRSEHCTVAGGKQIEVTTWPSSGTTISDTGVSGYTINALPATNYKVTAPDGSSAWKLYTNVTNQCLWYYHNPNVNNWLNLSYTISFYMNGWGAGNYNRLVIKHGASDLTQYFYFATNGSGQLIAGRRTTNSNTDSWSTNNQVCWLGNWYTVTVTWACGTGPGATPTFYVNGVNINTSGGGVTHTAGGSGYWYGDGQWQTIFGNRQAFDGISDVTFLTIRAENQVISAGTAAGYYTTDSARYSLPTTLTASANNYSPNINDTVTISGNLTSTGSNPPIGSTIIFSEQNVQMNTTIQVGTTTTTNSGGAYSWSFVPANTISSPQGGWPYILISYNGSASYQLTSVGPLTFTWQTQVNQAITLTSAVGATSASIAVSNVRADYTPTSPLTPVQAKGYSTAPTKVVSYDSTSDPNAPLGAPLSTNASIIPTSVVSSASPPAMGVPAATCTVIAETPHADANTSVSTNVVNANALAHETVVTVSHVDQIFTQLPGLSAYATQLIGAVTQNDCNYTLPSMTTLANAIAGTQILTVSHIDQILALMGTISANVNSIDPSQVHTAMATLTPPTAAATDVAGTTETNAVASYNYTTTPITTNSLATAPSYLTTFAGTLTPTVTKANAIAQSSVVAVSHIDQILGVLPPLQATVNPGTWTYRQDANQVGIPMYGLANAIAGTQLTAVSTVTQSIALLTSLAAYANTNTLAITQMDQHSTPTPLGAAGSPVEIGSSVLSNSWVYITLDVIKANAAAIAGTQLTGVSRCDSLLPTLVSNAAIGSASLVAISQVTQNFSLLAPLQAMANAIAETPTHIYEQDANSSLTSLVANANTISGTTAVNVSRVDQILGLVSPITANVNAISQSVTSSSYENVSSIAVNAVMVDAAAAANQNLAVNSINITGAFVDVSAVHAAANVGISSAAVNANSIANTTVVAVSHTDQIFSQLAPLQAAFNAIAGTLPVRVTRDDQILPGITPMASRANAVSGTEVTAVSHLTIVWVLAAPLYTNALARAGTKETWAEADWAGTATPVRANAAEPASTFAASYYKTVTPPVVKANAIANEDPTQHTNNTVVTILPIYAHANALTNQTQISAWAYGNAYFETVNSTVHLITTTTRLFDAQLPRCPSDQEQYPLPAPTKALLSITTTADAEQL